MSVNGVDVYVGRKQFGRMRPVPLFILACVLGGIGGLVGSMVGGAFGKERALFVGGVLGGLVIAPLTARIAKWRRWIPPEKVASTAIGAALGFAIAAAVAVATLSSPIGPILSTLLIGTGAVIGARWRGPRAEGSASS